GPGPDLAVLFVGAGHGGAIDDIAGAVRSVLGPTVLVGATAASILGGDREVEDQPAVALWAGSLGGVPLPVRLEAVRTADGVHVGGLPAEAAESDRTLLLLTDPFSLAADGLVEALAESHPRLEVIGGLASAARAPGGNRLVLDGRVVTDGAVGALLPAGA